VVGFAAIACFQAALALGTPLGRAAWGGTNARLPARLRVASLISAGVWVLAALVILGRTSYRVSPVQTGVARWATYVLVGVLALSAIMNTASRSNWERFLWGPVALILAVVCLLVAVGGAHPAVPAMTRASTRRSTPRAR
jgi:hypothetical protein